MSHTARELLMAVHFLRNHPFDAQFSLVGREHVELAIRIRAAALICGDY